MYLDQNSQNSEKRPAKHQMAKRSTIEGLPRPYIFIISSLCLGRASPKLSRGMRTLNYIILEIKNFGLGSRIGNTYTLAKTELLYPKNAGA